MRKEIEIKAFPENNGSHAEFRKSFNKEKKAYKKENKETDRFIKFADTRYMFFKPTDDSPWEEFSYDGTGNNSLDKKGVIKTINEYADIIDDYIRNKFEDDRNEYTNIARAIVKNGGEFNLYYETYAHFHVYASLNDGFTDDSPEMADRVEGLVATYKIKDGELFEILKRHVEGIDSVIEKTVSLFSDLFPAKKERKINEYR